MQGNKKRKNKGGENKGNPIEMFNIQTGLRKLFLDGDDEGGSASSFADLRCLYGHENVNLYNSHVS